MNIMKYFCQEIILDVMLLQNCKVRRTEEAEIINWTMLQHHMALT